MGDDIEPLGKTAELKQHRVKGQLTAARSKPTSDQSLWNKSASIVETIYGRTSG